LKLDLEGELGANALEPGLLKEGTYREEGTTDWEGKGRELDWDGYVRDAIRG
jgi:hypothetical protein